MKCEKCFKNQSHSLSSCRLVKRVDFFTVQSLKQINSTIVIIIGIHLNSRYFSSSYSSFSPSISRTLVERKKKKKDEKNTPFEIEHSHHLLCHCHFFYANEISIPLMWRTFSPPFDFEKRGKKFYFVVFFLLFFPLF